MSEDRDIDLPVTLLNLYQTAQRHTGPYYNLYQPP
jgi:hypothetical protein